MSAAVSDEATNTKDQAFVSAFCSPVSDELDVGFRTTWFPAKP
jgi:hypothetical protein